MPPQLWSIEAPQKEVSIGGHDPADFRLGKADCSCSTTFCTCKQLGMTVGSQSYAFTTYIKLFFMVGVASSSTRYSPREVKKSRSFTSSGQIPSAIRTIHKNLLISSPE